MKYWVVIALLVVGIGCGKKETIVTPGGTATVEENGDKTNMTVKSGEGTVNVEQDKSGNNLKVTSQNEKGEKSTMESSSNIDPKELGIAVYPGSQLSQKQGDSMKMDSPEQVAYNCKYTTSDGAGKVAEFFKKQLTDATSYASGDNCVVSGKSSSGDDVAINAQVDKKTKQTEIVISVIKKKKK
jgi:hypothetical protein